MMLIKSAGKHVMWLLYSFLCVCVYRDTGSKFPQTDKTRVSSDHIISQSTHVNTHNPSVTGLLSNLDPAKSFLITVREWQLVNFMARGWTVCAYLWFPDFDYPRGWNDDSSMGPQWTWLLYLVQHETCDLVVELQKEHTVGLEVQPPYRWWLHRNHSLSLNVSSWGICAEIFMTPPTSTFYKSP